eukprot:9481095-Pyramimonas_sp.AAC.1
MRDPWTGDAMDARPGDARRRPSSGVDGPGAGDRARDTVAPPDPPDPSSQPRPEGTASDGGLTGAGERAGLPPPRTRMGDEEEDRRWTDLPLTNLSLAKTTWDRTRRAWTRKNDGRDALSRTENGRFANRRVRVGGLSTPERRRGTELPGTNRSP